VQVSHVDNIGVLSAGMIIIIQGMWRLTHHWALLDDVDLFNISPKPFVGDFLAELARTLGRVSGSAEYLEGGSLYIISVVRSS
jgi:hypothetical protein